jgi:hypothetical protein
MYVFLPLHLSHDACVSIEVPIPFLGGPHSILVVCMYIAHGSLEATKAVVMSMYMGKRCTDEFMPSKYVLIHHSLGTSSAFDPFGRLVINVIPCPFVPVFTQHYTFSYTTFYMLAFSIDY